MKVTEQQQVPGLKYKKVSEQQKLQVPGLKYKKVTEQQKVQVPGLKYKKVSEQQKVQLPGLKYKKVTEQLLCLKYSISDPGSSALLTVGSAYGIIFFRILDLRSRILISDSVPRVR